MVLATGPITPALFSVGLYDTVASRPREWNRYSIVAWPRHFLLVMINNIKGLWLKTYNPADIKKSFKSLTFQTVRFLSNKLTEDKLNHLLSDLKNVKLFDDSGTFTEEGKHLLRLLNSCCEKAGLAGPKDESISNILMNAFEKEDILSLREAAEKESCRPLLAKVVDQDQFLYDRLAQRLTTIPRSNSRSRPVGEGDAIFKLFDSKLQKETEARKKEITDKLVEVIKSAYQTGFNRLSISNLKLLNPHFEIAQLIQLRKVFRHYPDLLKVVNIELCRRSQCPQNKVAEELRPILLKFKTSEEVEELYIEDSDSEDFKEVKNGLVLFQGYLASRGQQLLLDAKNAIVAMGRAFEAAVIMRFERDAKFKDQLVKSGSELTIRQLALLKPSTRKSYLEERSNELLLKYLDPVKSIPSGPLRQAEITVGNGALEVLLERNKKGKFKDIKDLQQSFSSQTQGSITIADGFDQLAKTDPTLSEREVSSLSKSIRALLPKKGQGVSDTP